MKPILTLLTTLLLAPLGALPAAVGEGQSAQSDVLLTNRKAWEDLAARGNPLLLLNAERFQNPQPAFKPPEKVPNTWTYRVIAEQLVPAAYAATAQQSPHRGRADLVAHCVAVADWLTQQCDANGLWYRREGTGDPNVNRFTLGPLLDAVDMLQTLPAGREAWPRWKDKLDRALDHQRRAFRGEFDWEWVHPEVKYPNQDLYGPLCFWLSAELYGRDEDRQLAQHILRKTTENLLPDGGLHYIGIENESPVYHALNLILIARYATLSHDPVAVKLLKDTANYWPLVLTAEFFDTFGTGSVERVPQYARAPETWWPGVQLRQNLNGGAKSGQRFVYSVWIGPPGTTPPTAMRLLPQDRGWLATWPTGRQAAAVFNPTPASLTIEVPWSAAAPKQWSQDGTSQPLPTTGGHVSVSLPANECALFEE